MKSVGIITIHKINNYGSVLQAYALQKTCEDLGYNVEIIDYDFPNAFHANNRFIGNERNTTNEPRWIKALFSKSLISQHRGIRQFVNKWQHLSSEKYLSPDDLMKRPPVYDIYITGSDQLWSPTYCNGDTAFMLSFAPDEAPKISYAASLGTNKIPHELVAVFRNYLSRYKMLSVRETSGSDEISRIIGKPASVVVDPTLLLNQDAWNKIATPKRIVKNKYILCYFLNYSFNAFPYVDKLAKHIQQSTGYELVWVARPPHSLNFSRTTYKVGATPQEFVALIRDSEMVLTTSFHGTAFALNYGKPLFTIVKDKGSSDSRQINLMHSLGLEQQIVLMDSAFPTPADANYETNSEQSKLNILRNQSKEYLTTALKG